jgi:hypothetical protein
VFERQQEGWEDRADTLRGGLVDRLVGRLDGRVSTTLSPSLDPLLSV